MGDNETKRREDAFTKALNSHGYGFQYAVPRLVEHLGTFDGFAWDAEVSEFPVEVQGADTRIDFILRSKSRDQGHLVLLFCECKRANPALSDWCFCRGPFVTRKTHAIEEMLADSVEQQIHGDISVKSVRIMCAGFKTYNVAIELRTDSRGDSQGKSGRSAIESAMTQVLRGVNGYIEFLGIYTRSTQPEAFGQTLIPVVFTTASLYVSDVDLGLADIQSGEVSGAKLERVQWVVYQYHVSPGLKHSLEASFSNALDLPEVLTKEYIRSVIIVGASHTKDFLYAFTRDQLNIDRIR